MKPSPRWALVILAGTALALGGCSSSSDEPAGTTTTPAATAAAAPSADGGSGAGVDARLASRLCTQLSKTTAQLQLDNASAVAAQAQIAMALASVYGDDVAKMDGSAIESMTKETCPEVHDEALATMEKDSFDQL